MSGYLTQTDIANIRINGNAPATRAQIIEDLISKDLESPEKKEMQEGVAYFDGLNPAIMGRKQYYYDKNGKKVVETDTNKTPNHKLAHSYSYVQIAQKSTYIAGTPITVTSKDEGVDAEKYLDELNKLMGRKFNDYLMDIIENASKKGFEGTKIVIDTDKDGKSQFKYVDIGGEELITIYDAQYQDTLEEVIRYYKTTFNGEKVIRAEWWNATEVTYFQQVEEDGTYIEQETLPHMQSELVVEGKPPEQVDENPWGRPPFVIYKNSTDCIPDHRYIKTLMDNYDLTSSDFANALDALGEAIIAISGYDGQDAGEARNNIKMYRVVTTHAEDGAGVNAIEVTIDNEAKDSHLDRLDSDINFFGMAVNQKESQIGEASGVALKYRYSLLDIKANRMIRKLNDALYDLFWFMTEWINRQNGTKYDVETLVITFNISMLMNEAELIDNLTKSTDLSQKTRLMKHPYVDNVEDELDRLATEPKVEIPMGDEDEN